MASLRPRITVVTGARSGIGKATAELLLARGERVIGIDLPAPRSTRTSRSPAGRDHAIAAVQALCPDGIDALVECAGLSTSDGPAVVSVNFFGAVAIAEGLHPLLALGRAPRCVIVSSTAAFLPVDERIVTACLEGDESRARDLARSASEKDAQQRSGRRSTAPRSGR